MESIKCGICKENNPELLQGHHLCYKPEIIVFLCIPCHSIQHKNHGVGRGIISKKDLLILYYLKKLGNKEISSKDIYRFYFGQTHRKVRIFEQVGLLKRKKYTEHPVIYKITNKSKQGYYYLPEKFKVKK